MSLQQRANRIMASMRLQESKAFEEWYQTADNEELESFLSVLVASLTAYEIVTLPEDLPQEAEARHEALRIIYASVLNTDSETVSAATQILYDTWLCEQERRKQTIKGGLI